MNFGGALLADRRVISIDRPGLGHSSPHEEKTLLSVVEDVQQLIDHLSLGTPLCVANSQGAPFGLALALTGGISALVLVSPADEVAHPSIHRLLPEELRGLVDLVTSDPAAATAALTEFTADSMMDLVMNQVPETDRPVYRDPAFISMYRRSLREGFQQGSRGYAQDAVLAMSDWDLPLDAMPIPVSIWYGRDDHVHSPDQGELLASRIPGARREIVEGVGGSLLWSPARARIDL
jgi:pimeloyl-ACP methyl ester carboxylesterase